MTTSCHAESKSDVHLVQHVFLTTVAYRRKPCPSNNASTGGGASDLAVNTVDREWGQSGSDECYSGIVRLALHLDRVKILSSWEYLSAAIVTRTCLEQCFLLVEDGSELLSSEGNVSACSWRQQG